MSRKLYISCDHRGWDLRNFLLGNFHLPEDYEWVDLGPFEKNPADDFNSAAIAVAKSVLEDPGSLGVIICGSGHGVTIQANRFKGIRAILGLTPKLARLGREHNDANIICLSADFQNLSAASLALDAFLNAKFINTERYQRRNAILDQQGANLC